MKLLRALALPMLAWAANGITLHAADILVTTTNDTGAGSLRAAITQANASPGSDRIIFAIPGAGTQTIAPASPLPAIVDPVIIDGFTQGDARPNTALLSEPNNAIIRIELDGNAIADQGSGIVIGDDATSATGIAGTRIRGLAIGRFPESGIEVRAGGAAIEGNFIGTDSSATLQRSNIASGIHVLNTSGIGFQIGGPLTTSFNIISGNKFCGIHMEGALSSGTLVHGNFIGTARSGLTALANRSDGIFAQDSASNIIGNAGAGNVISGNSESGIRLSGAGSRINIVAGNVIGVTNTGSAALGNHGEGIKIEDGDSNVLGGDDAATGNLISANGSNGIGLSSAYATLIQGNVIGLNRPGTAALPNLTDGISLDDATTGTLIGGATPSARNIISANAEQGIDLGFDSTQNNIVGNYIGSSANGLAALGNGFSGIAVASPSNVIGGPAGADRNVIVGNGRAGISLSSIFTTSTTVQGNYIGIGADGETALGNIDPLFVGAGQGINLQNAKGNRIIDNTISANSSEGIALRGSSSSNVIQLNKIGTTASGFAPRPNQGDGISIAGSAMDNRIGGTDAATQGNLIANNAGSGVSISGLNNLVLGNAIHSNTLLGIDLSGDGPTANDDTDNDDGANHLQNFPLLESLGTINGLALQGTLTSKPNTTYRIEFFASPSADPSGSGEGAQYLGSQIISTDILGSAPFTQTVPVSAITPQAYSATATDPEGNTSEFSNVLIQTKARNRWALYK